MKLKFGSIDHEILCSMQETVQSRGMNIGKSERSQDFDASKHKREVVHADSGSACLWGLLIFTWTELDLVVECWGG